MQNIDYKKVQLNEYECFYVVHMDDKHIDGLLWQHNWAIIRDYGTGINFETLFFLSHCYSKDLGYHDQKFIDYTLYKVKEKNRINRFNRYCDSLYLETAKEYDIDAYFYNDKPFEVKIINDKMLADLLDILLHWLVYIQKRRPEFSQLRPFIFLFSR